jgi:hypothetical protein
MAQRALALHKVRRRDWPADVLAYQHRIENAKRRARRERDRAGAAAADERRRQREQRIEESRQQEQQQDDDNDNNDEEGDDDEQHDSRAPQRRSLEYDARAKRRRKNAADAAAREPVGLMSHDENSKINAEPLQPVSDDRCREIVDRVRLAMSDEKQGERVCACCDELVLKCDSSIGRCCQQLVDNIVARCSVASQVPPLDDLLAAQYDCSSVLPAFDSCLLSPLAFRVARHELGTANVAELPCICGRTRHAPPNVLHDIAMPLCNSCLRSLLRCPSAANAPPPPLFAIANGFAIGRLPSSLSDVTVHEEAMVSPVFPSGKSRRQTN